MANYSIKFYGTEETKTNNSNIECFANTSGSITIILDGEVICLDVSTAIKFAKTLRTEINVAKEIGGNNE